MRRPIKAILAATVLASIGTVGFARPVSAQGMPSPFLQEVLVKSMLVTLSDASAADNFTVLHAKISKPFRDEFPVEKLRAIFKDMADKHAVFDVIVAMPMIADAETKIDENGILRLQGHFATTPKQVKYRLGFMPSDGKWKLSAVAIDIE